MPRYSQSSPAPSGADIVPGLCPGYRPRRRRGFRFLFCTARIRPIVWENNPPAQKRHKFLFGAWGYTRAPWRFPMNALPFFPPDAGITISTLRVDDIRLCRTISTPAAWTIFASRGSQTMKPRNHFGFGASFTLAAIYSRGTCRPTRRPTAVRAASQPAPAVCPRLRG